MVTAGKRRALFTALLIGAVALPTAAEGARRRKKHKPPPAPAVTKAPEPEAPVAPTVDAVDPLSPGLTRDPKDKDRPKEKPATPRYLPENESSARVQIRKLAYNLATAFKALPGEGRFQTIAVLPFIASDEAAKKERVAQLVTSELSTDLERDHGLWLLERAAIEDAIHETYLAETGITDPKGAAKLGELLSAQALVVGEVQAAGATFLVNARVISTETGTVFATAQTSLPAADLIAFARDAVVLRTRAGAIFRSVLIPGWGQIYNLEKAKGYGLLATEVGVLGTALGFQLIGMKTHADYYDNGDASLLATEKRLYQARNVLLIVAAGIWAYNVLDAGLNGADFDALEAQGGR